MISLVRACADDAAALRAAKADAFSDDVVLYGFGPPDYDSLEDTSRAIIHPDNHYYKILSDGELIGGVCALDCGGGHFHLNSIYVFTQAHGRGIGTVAMRLLFGMLPQAVRWTLETPYLSFRNHHFYEKLGFVETGQTEPDADGFYLLLYERNG